MQAHQKIADFRTQKNLTLQGLAERVGTTKSQIDKLERGERRLTVEWLERIAEALDVPLAAFFAFDPAADAASDTSANVLTDPAYMPYDLPRRDAARLSVLAEGGMQMLPVYGRSDPLTDQLTQMDKIASHIACPPALAGVKDAYAVYMVGDGMEPRYFAGDVLYVDPSRPLTRGCFILLTLHDDTAQVRRLLRRTEEGLLLVQQTGRDRDETLPLPTLRSVHRIIGSMEQG
jgi:transcriptional regulator with XRE-family HTH domain